MLFFFFFFFFFAGAQRRINRPGGNPDSQTALVSAVAIPVPPAFSVPCLRPVKVKCDLPTTPRTGRASRRWRRNSIRRCSGPRRSPARDRPTLLESILAFGPTVEAARASPAARRGGDDLRRADRHGAAPGDDGGLQHRWGVQGGGQWWRRRWFSARPGPRNCRRSPVRSTTRPATGESLAGRSGRSRGAVVGGGRLVCLASPQEEFAAGSSPGHQAGRHDAPSKGQAKCVLVVDHAMRG